SFPHPRFFRRRVTVQEGLVQEIAPDGGERRGPEPHEQRGLCQILPEDAAEDEDDEQRSKVADKRKPEQQRQPCEVKCVGDRRRVRRSIVRARGHSAPRAGLRAARLLGGGSVTFRAWVSYAICPSFS